MPEDISLPDPNHLPADLTGVSEEPCPLRTDHMSYLTGTVVREKFSLPLPPPALVLAHAGPAVGLPQTDGLVLEMEL